MLGLLVSRPLWGPPPHPEPCEGGPATEGPPVTSGCLQISSVIEAEAEVMCCRFSPDGSLVAMGLANGTIKIHELRGWTCVHVLRDADTLRHGDTRGHAETRRHAETPRHALRHGVPVTSLVFLPQTDTERDIRLVATYASGRVSLWAVSLRWACPLAREATHTLCAAASPSGAWVATGGGDGALRIYDVKTRSLALTCSPSASSHVMDGHSSRIFAVQWHPESENFFLSGGWDNTVQFWDRRMPHSVRSLYGPHVCGESLHFDSSGSQILSGSWRKRQALQVSTQTQLPQVWDSGSGSLIRDIPPEADGERSSTTGSVSALPGGVYCIDVTSSSTSSSTHLIAVASSTSLYLLTHSQQAA
ncbi:unnamed protein product [Lampetra planeri]